MSVAGFSRSIMKVSIPNGTGQWFTVELRIQKVPYLIHGQNSMLKVLMGKFCFRSLI